MSLEKNFQLKISNLSHDGRGIGNIDGKTIFLFGGLPDETVLFHYQHRHRKYDEGCVTQVLTPAPDRVSPRCLYFGTCAGCQLQHLSSEAQLKHKEKILLEHFLHQAHCTPLEMLSPIQANAWEYRRKARLSVKYVSTKNKVFVGFREHHPRKIADMAQCAILHPSVGKNIAAFSDLLLKLDSKNHIPQIEIAVGDVSTAIIVRHMKPLPQQDLNLLIAFSDQYHYQLYLQSERGLEKVNTNYFHESLYYDLKSFSLRFYFEPLQFIQVHAAVNEKMIARAIELLALNKNDTVLDLFCGIGNFSLPMAQYAKQVIGVEGLKSSVMQAKKNALHNNIHPVEFYEHDLTKSLNIADWSRRSFDKVLLDPPRTGAQEIIPYFSVWKPERIVYISCHPITLARDAKSLLDLGYRLEKTGVLDMFPHTQHVEAIALFSSARHDRRKCKNDFVRKNETVDS